MHIFAKERQDKIYELVQKNGAVTTAFLVEKFQVSIETIRRDLLHMEQDGKISRVHGGAIEKVNMNPFLKLPERNQAHSEQKRVLSFRALEFIAEGDIIGIDSGSTAIAFAQALKEKFSKLTIITHSTDVFNLLRDHEDFSVILCGGYYMRHENAFYGELTLDMLKTLHIQKCFIFPSAVSLEYGIWDYQKELYQVQKQMIKSSDEIFVLADSSKFEKKALLKIDDMKNEYVYVTDQDLSEELIKIYKENNITIHIGGRRK